MKNNIPFKNAFRVLALLVMILPTIPLIPCGAQGIRCTYTHKKIDDPQNKKKTRQYRDVLLDLDQGRSLFYSEADFVYDSLFSLSFDKNGKQLQNEAAEQLTRTRSGMHWMTEINYLSGTFTQYDKFLQTIIGNGTLEMPSWKITDETQEIAGYDCRKAVAHYLGREWTAWFTEEIPVQAGPWLLWGLPGLIVDARDADQYIIFTLTGIVPLADGHRAEFMKDWMRNHKSGSLQVYEYDFREAQAVVLKMHNDISFAAHMSNPGAKLMTKDETGKIVPLQSPPYIPLIPPEYWKTR